MPEYQYYNNLFKGNDLPLAYIDIDLLDKNIEQLIQRAGKANIRVASKSVRCVEMLKRILNASEQIQGIMSFTIKEALFLLSKGFDDILLGYPSVNKNDLQALVQATKEGKKIIPMTDSVVHFELINEVAKAENIIQPICIDIDMSSKFPGIYFGVYRSPINSMEKFEALINELPKFEHIKLTSIMGYEAQIAGLGDKNPHTKWQNGVVKILQKKSIKELAKRRKAVIEMAREKGHEITLVNGGGTGSIESTLQEDYITEVTVGSGFYSPALFDNYSHFKHLPAVGYALEIVRKPAADIYTLLGGGYVASGGIGIDKQALPYLPNGVKLFSNEGTGEVQTPFRYNGNEKIALGDTVLMRHAKAGELCERFNELHVVSNGGIIDKVKTYRGEGKCFL